MRAVTYVICTILLLVGSVALSPGRESLRQYTGIYALGFLVLLCANEICHAIRSRP